MYVFVHACLCVYVCVLQKARELHLEEQSLWQLEADRACVSQLLVHHGKDGPLEVVFLVHHGKGGPLDAQRRQEAVRSYTASREERVESFLGALQLKRDLFFTSLSTLAAQG